MAGPSSPTCRASAATCSAIRPTICTPMLDTPEAIAAADFFSNMLREYGPDGVLSYTYDQVVEALQAGPHQLFDQQRDLPGADGASRTARSPRPARLSLMPAGPRAASRTSPRMAGAFRSASRNKDAAWEFIKWAMSKELHAAHVQRKGLQLGHPRAR